MTQQNKTYYLKGFIPLKVTAECRKCHLEATSYLEMKLQEHTLHLVIPECPRCGQNASPEKVREMSIHELYLSERIRYCLQGHGIETVQDLIKLSPFEVRELHGIGHLFTAQIITELKRFGLSLGEK